MVLHVWTTMAMVQQWWLFILQAHSPPWSYLRLLEPDLRPSSCRLCKDVHELFLRLESSEEPFAVRWRNVLFQRQWPVVREPLLLLERADWVVDDGVVDYVEAMWPGCEHSLAEEYVFNALRDNETRGAHHKQRSSELLAALSVASSSTRYARLRQVEVEPSDLAQLSRMTVKADVFSGAEAVKPSSFDADTASITAGGGVASWPTTSVDAFTTVQCSAVQVLWGGKG